jgi:hypothetical protein
LCPGDDLDPGLCGSADDQTRRHIVIALPRDDHVYGELSKYRRQIVFATRVEAVPFVVRVMEKRWSLRRPAVEWRKAG